MPTSIFDTEFQDLLKSAKKSAHQADGPFPSPADWRDKWIYFLMVDRFNNKDTPPLHQPFDDPRFDGFQGGKYSGIKDKLPYLKKLGVGAIWLSPVLKNLQFSKIYHGYGIHDFLHAEPRFADNPEKADDELRDLVDAAHAENIYIIFDIVLNHTGDVFAYECDADDKTCNESHGSEARSSATTRTVWWREGTGAPRFPSVEHIAKPSRDALVWPKELQKDEFFRKQGATRPPPDDTVGDFASLKQMRTQEPTLQNVLIRAYQYVVARFDVDGFRIDTLRYLQGDLPRLFGNAIREFAQQIGKQNFFTFGEVFDRDAEEDIARFIGRNTRDANELVGVDAAVDVPVYEVLRKVTKGLSPPSDLVSMFHLRKEKERDVLSSHGDATRFFVTFLDNHDVQERFRFVDPKNKHRFDDQVTLAFACLYALPGIPCLYYGSEQGLHGHGSDPAVREALWGGPGFSEANFFYGAIQQIARVRSLRPPLRYGRFYFRPTSIDGHVFRISTSNGGVLAFSRILNDEEIVVVANTNVAEETSVEIIVDIHLNRPGARFKILYSNKGTTTMPLVHEISAATVQEVDGGIGCHPVQVIRVALRPCEVQLLAQNEEVRLG
jgi:glycosidase